MGRHKYLKIHIQGKREAVEQWKVVYLICYKVMKGERMFAWLTRILHTKYLDH